jgi:microcystin-dependent protein
MLDNRGATNLGSIRGSDTVTLTVANLPAHQHTGTTNSDGSHSHTIKCAASGGWASTRTGTSFTSIGAHEANGGTHAHQFTTAAGAQGSLGCAERPFTVVPTHLTVTYLIKL